MIPASKYTSRFSKTAASARIRERAGESLPILLFFALLGALTLTKLLGAVDPDLFWHLKNGEITVRHARLPMVDDYSFTAIGGRLAANAWLSEALFYLIFQAGHYLALAIFHTLLVTGAYVLFYLALARPGLSKGNQMLLTAGFFAAFLPFLAPRTQNFSFIFFTAFLWLARRWENGDEKALWKMAVLIPLWNNLHSGFAVGFLILILISLQAVWERKKSPSQAAAPLGLAALLGMVHPNGPKALFYPVWEAFLTPPQIDIIREWKPIDLNDTSVALPFFILSACLMWLGIARAQSAGSDKGRFPWGILALVFFFAGVFSQRLVPYFALSGLMALAIHFPSLAGKRFFGARVLAGWVLACGFTFHYFFPGIKGVFPWRSEDWTKSYPREAADVISRDYPGKNIFCAYDWGGYLIYRLYPSNKVAIDGRSDLYYRFIPAYERIMRGGPRAEKLLKKIGAHVALVPPRTPLAQWFLYAKTWKKVWGTPKESLFVAPGQTAPEVSPGQI